MRKHLNKIENFITCFGEYGQVSNKVDNIRRVCFQSLIPEVLNENKLLCKYPQVRYHFNLLKSKSIISDHRKVKIILKHLLVNAFHTAATSDNPEVSLSIESDEKQSLIQVSNSGCLIEDNFERNIFKLFYSGSNPSEAFRSGLFLIKESIKKLQGKILLSSSSEKESTLNIIIPDLETQNSEKYILPYTSAALRVV